MDQGMNRASMIRIAAVVLVGIGLAVLIYYSPAFFNKDANATVPQLKTGGTASVFFMLDGWKAPYRKEKGVNVDYDSNGSTQGIADVIDKKTAVGFTHAPLSEEQLKQAKEKGGEVLHIPVVICAVVPVYNIEALAKEKEPLQLNGEVLAKIFLGEIKRWNHDDIKKLNPKEVADKLPDEEIKVIHREDSSGTTYIFAQYLYEVSDAWKDAMGKPKSELKWKVGKGAERNKGVADLVRDTPGAIGYVELLHTYTDEYSEGNNPKDLKHAAVRNKDDTAYVHADPKKMTAAAEKLGKALRDDLTFELTNKPGDDAYPICGAIWAVCYQNQPAGEREKVVDFLQWITHDGQKYAAKRTYAPLPDEVVRRADEKIKTIK
jgi:phosphate transport system substrate-binding protein